MSKAALSLSLAFLLAGSAHAAGGGWRWTWQSTRGTAPYVFHMYGSKIIPPIFVAGHLRRFTVLLDDGHGEPFYVMTVEINANRASANVDEPDQDARPTRHFTGSFRRTGDQDNITLSADGERIVLTGNPPSR